MRQLDDEIVAVVTAANADDALAALSRFRLLCATNRGPYGVETLNYAIERHLRERGLVDARRAGTADARCSSPQTITTSISSTATSASAFPTADGQMRVWFPTTEGGLRAIAPGEPPAARHRVGDDRSQEPGLGVRRVSS